MLAKQTVCVEMQQQTLTDDTSVYSVFSVSYMHNTRK